MSKGLYPIRTIAAMTGINPVTLRAWERRYGLITPQRTPKGHRLYTEADIERIQHILTLLERGIPISQAQSVMENAGFADETTRHTGHQDHVTDTSGWDQHHIHWLKALETFDEHALSDACDDSLSLFPVDVVLLQLACPLLTKLKINAVTDASSRAQWHFFQSFIRNKLSARFIHDTPRSIGPRLLLACPASECDDSQLLMLAIAAQARGYRVIMLGLNVDNAALQAAVKGSRCTGLILASTSNQPPQGLLSAMREITKPVFLLDAASDWPLKDADHFTAVPDTATALRIIGQRLPPASGSSSRRPEHTGAA